MTKANCNECREEFAVTSVLTRVLPEMVYYNYFECPHCRTEYYVSYSSIETRRIQRQLDMLRRRIPAIQDNRTILKKQLKKIDVLAMKHETAMRQLEDEMHA